MTVPYRDTSEGVWQWLLVVCHEYAEDADQSRDADKDAQQFPHPRVAGKTIEVARKVFRVAISQRCLPLMLAPNELFPSTVSRIDGSQHIGSS